MTNTIDNGLERKVYFYGDLCAHFQGECHFGKATVDERNHKIREAGDELLAAINKTIMEAEARAKIEGAYEQLVSLRMDVLQVNPDHTKASTLMVIDQSIRQLEPKLSEAFWEAQLFPTKKYGRADNE